MQTQRFGFRSAEYSSWHRMASLRRYLGEDLASTLSTVDLDNAIWIEHSDGAKEPLLLVETALPRLARRTEPWGTLPGWRGSYQGSSRVG